MSQHLLTWAAWDEPRWEQAHVEIGLGRMHARGTVLAGGDNPFRADYELDTTAGLVTRRLLVRVTGSRWSRRLLLTRDPDGEWMMRRTVEPNGAGGAGPAAPAAAGSGSGPGAAAGSTEGTAEGPAAGAGDAPPGEAGLAGTADLRDALDCDLAGSPLTNTMPVLRHMLHRREGRQEFVMAWVALPELTVAASRQTYEHVRTEEDGGLVRFFSDGFTAEVGFDACGFVTTYPRVGRRV